MTTVCNATNYSYTCNISTPYDHSVINIIITLPIKLNTVKYLENRSSS